MRFYLASPRPNKDKLDDFTGLHPAAQHWIYVTQSRVVVGLPDRIASPAGYRLVAQGKAIDSLQVDAPARAEMQSYFSLKRALRTNSRGELSLGRAIAQALTLGADVDVAAAPNPLNPTHRGQMQIRFGGRIIFREPFNDSAEYATELYKQKRKAYKAKRAVDVDLARKWLEWQRRKGFTDTGKVQGKGTGEDFSGDGKPLNPDTSYTESALGNTLDLAWTNIDGANPIAASGANEYFGRTGLPSVVHGSWMDSALSSDDYTVTAEIVTAAGADDQGGPMCRGNVPLSSAQAYRAGTGASSAGFYLVRCRSNDPANLGILDQVAIVSSQRIGTMTITCDGSDISASWHDGTSPYNVSATDTNAPTGLHAGAWFYRSNASYEMSELTADDGLSGGGGGDTTGEGRPHRANNGTLLRSFTPTGSDHE